MADKKKEKPVRVQFPKDSTAKEILAGIRKVQDEWARKNPREAHAKYPDIHTETGERTGER